MIATRPATARIRQYFATNASVRVTAEKKAPLWWRGADISGVTGRDSLGVIDALDHVFELVRGDELVVHRLHRILEGLLVDLDDLRPGGNDARLGLRFLLVPELAH